MPDRVAVAILDFPAIGERQEFAALEADERAEVRWADSGSKLKGADLVILPGSEQTMADLRWMRERGLDAAVLQARAAGARLLGICGGLQILGSELLDPASLEGGEREAAGLGVFDLVTVFARPSIDEPTVGTLTGALGPAGGLVTGREIHGGRSVLSGAGVSAVFREPAKGGGDCPLGFALADRTAFATYLHGALADDALRGALLEAARAGPR